MCEFFSSPICLILWRGICLKIILKLVIFLRFCGEIRGKIFIAVHGNMSNKEDAVIQILAEEADRKGYQVLSFDLPEHGEERMITLLVKYSFVLMNYL